jgi:outer membrane protein assembly factor BamB
MKTPQVHLVVLVLLVCSQPLDAADWPQWRGPQRNGISAETGLLPEWPKDGPKLLWRVDDIDYGYSTSAVVGDFLYLLSNKGMDDEFVRALAVRDGKPVWSTRLGKVGPNKGPQFPAARSTPTVDGERLYALGSAGDLACLETDTGKIQWQKNLVSDFGGQHGNWAYSESPLIDGDHLICTPGGKEATLLCLNKETGEVIWKSAVPEGDAAGYASANIIDAAGHKQYVQFLGKGVVGVDAKTGKFLWRYDQTGKGPANIPTPVVQAEYVYSSGGQSGFGGLVRLKADKDSVATESVYYERNLPVAIGGAILLDGHLYGTTAQELVCAEFTTGKIKWHDKCLGAGAICCADGRLYIHGENGQVALVEATPPAYRELGRFTPSDQPKHTRGNWEKAWAYPVVANGRLYIRDLGTLWCYDIRNSHSSK